MCGIVGVLNLDPERPAPRELISGMMDQIAHRGPDGHGLTIEGPVGLGHRRLSILDLDSGQQPMWSRNRQCCIAYNGEIYNFLDLRSRLNLAAGDYRTSCDTEVLLELAASGGTDWLNHLNGMFAFAVWNQETQSLFLARDRMGIKPLYTMVIDNQFWFSSEIKALLMHPLCQRSVDRDAMSEYMVFRRVNEPRTMFPQIKMLPPGHHMTVSYHQDSFTTQPYWSDAGTDGSAPDLDPKKDGESQFQDILDDAVRLRLISDVPVGTYNSGGVDSTLITASVRRQTDGPLHTFSVGFEEATHDESEYAQIVADRIGTEHHKLIVDQAEYAAHFQEAIWYNEEPLHHAHTVQLRLLSRFAKQFVTVVLTGEGADEGFAGYPRYQIPLLSNWLRHVPAFMLKTAHHILNATGARRASKLLDIGNDLHLSIVENARFVPRDTLSRIVPERPRLSSRDAIYDRSRMAPLGLLEQVLVYDRATYMPSLLHRLDRTTMASGVEARVPFLDHRLIDWSKTIPQAWKMKIGRENKVLLKSLAAKSFPSDMIYRRKMGFDVPISEWLRSKGPFSQYLDILQDKTFRERGYYAPGVVDNLVKEHLTMAKDHGDVLWQLINLELWHRSFIDDLGQVS